MPVRDHAELTERLAESERFLRSCTDLSPSLAVILGSGLGSFADGLPDSISIHTSRIPYYPASTVVGHSGKWVLGRLNERDILAMAGRVHYYEGYDLDAVTYPIRLMRQLGVRSLIVTNAAGGVNRAFNPGDLMFITSHINFMFANPLTGPNDERVGPRFPDMESDYDREFVDLAETVAMDLGIRTQRGVYCAGSGPTYETKAEVRMFQRMGADAVGMSTVPEVIVARHSGMRVLGISCITNMGTGISPVPLSHDEVTETATRVKESFQKLLSEIIRRIQP